MKTIKSLLTIFIFTALLSNVAYAQTVNVDATANVYSALSIDFASGAAGTLNFGGLMVGSTQYTATVTDDDATNAGETAAAATGTINGDANAELFISHSASAIMENSNADQLTVTPIVYVDGEEISQAGEVVDLEAATTPIAVGGSVTIENDTPTGTYSTGTGGGQAIVVTFNYQ